MKVSKMNVFLQCRHWKKVAFGLGIALIVVIVLAIVGLGWVLGWVTETTAELQSLGTI
jgi:hypothetical protein